MAHQMLDILRRLNHGVAILIGIMLLACAAFVLMDIVMPEMNGIEATQLITKNYPHIAVIGLTSIYGDVDQRTAMLDAGAVACLPKNASIQEIEQAIRRSKQTML